MDEPGTSATLVDITAASITVTTRERTVKLHFTPEIVRDQRVVVDSEEPTDG